MKFRWDRQQFGDGFSIVDSKGRIHRPCLYIMHKDCGWQWEMLNNKRTGHWHMVIGRLVFTTM